jgi:hypothetical protein
MVILRIFKAVWFVSVIAVLAFLLYSYATLKEDVVVYEDGAEMMRISRDMFFYLILGLLAFINVLVYIIAKIMVSNIEYRTWFYGLIITFNIFFIIAIAFISLYNSGEIYDYSKLEVILYSSIGLFSFWTVGWPIYIGYKRFVGQS